MISKEEIKTLLADIESERVERTTNKFYTIDENGNSNGRRSRNR